MISYFSENIKIPTISRRKTSAWIRLVASRYNRKIGEIAYIFCDDKKILQINSQYLKHNYYTDIITFDYSENNTVSGDIFVSVSTVESNSKKFGVSLDEELHRVIIHGILHLCGQNDKTPEEQAQMRTEEDEALKSRLCD
ncbi:MAG: rRNA maturation RNase YbeY [Prevotellaceae bacterium]|jgi:rRNA maturation RNase YbeY|nr:rRNA maturation RNase YbeY [Prevotellaceae bacterium]